MILTLCIPIFAVGVVAEFGGLITGQASPGPADDAVATGGLLASLAVVIVALYSTVVAIHFPTRIPTASMVTSSLDFVGVALILALVAVGVA